jgi:hypothetical protein
MHERVERTIVLWPKQQAECIEHRDGSDGISDFADVMLHQAHWWILLCVVIALGLRGWGAWQVRRLSR